MRSQAAAALSLLLLAAPALARQQDVDPEPHVDRKVVGYFIEWGVYARDYHPLDIPAEKLTHVNYAFANIGPDLRIQLGDPYAAIDRFYPGDTWDQDFRGAYNQLNRVLKAQHPHLKTLISVGGWTWSGLFSDVALTPASRASFAESCVEFLRTYEFDGVDIDWEYPVCCGLGSNTYRPEDKQNYTLLMAELRAQLDQAGRVDGRDYLLTIAAAAGYDKLENYEMAELASHLDWVNVMAYDFRGAWDLSHTAHHAPLRRNPADPSGDPGIREKYNVAWTLNAWVDAGVPADKVVMGLPFYGRAWGGVPSAGGGLFQPATHMPWGTWDDAATGATGLNEFWELELFEASPDYAVHWDPASKASYLYNPGAEGGHFISYESARSLRRKLRLVNRKGFGGVMFWELSCDRNGTLTDVIQQHLRR